MSERILSTNTSKCNQPAVRLVRKRVSSLIPSRENETIYRPVQDDPDIESLAARIKRNGCDPLTITGDNYIISGHRRRAALQVNGQKFVECRVLAIRRADLSADERVQLLRDHNVSSALKA